MEGINSMRLLISGGTGFVGQNVVPFLCKNHNVVLVVENYDIPILKTERYKNVTCVTINELDTRNFESFDACIHFASAGVKYGTATMKEMIDVNIVFSLKLMNFCIKNKTGLFINVGTCLEYKGNSNSLINESREFEPKTDYTSTKTAAYYILNQTAKRSNLPMITIRPFNLYGPYDSLTQLVPSIIIAGIKKQKVDLSPGEQIRDFLHVNDLSYAIECLLRNQKKLELYSSYNICSSKGISIKDLTFRICSLCNFDRSLYNFGGKPYRQNEDMFFVGDNSKISNHTGWKPRIRLDDVVFDLIDYYSKF